MEKEKKWSQDQALRVIRGVKNFPVKEMGGRALREV